VFGIVGTFLPVPVACVAFVVLGFLRGNVTTIIDSRHPDVQLVQTTYATNSRGSEQKAKESEYRELRQADGTWLRDGLYVHWSPTGRKLEEGSYTLGMRTGPWTFWNEDSSVDHVKSGVYENDVKVRD
jgi:antitoxin component YwqK of YwqJK toxin-antitoxin module